jgi:AcrR family transcriptional regulator
MGSDDVVRIDRTFTTQQVADNLGIGKSTLNKYSRSLEEAGYSFFKDDSDRRAYLERDLIALRGLKEMLTKNVEYDSAIKAICSKHSSDVSNLKVAMAAMPQYERYVEQYEQLVKIVVEQNQKIDHLAEIILNREQSASLSLPHAEQQRMDRLGDRLTERRIERKLENEGLEAWLAKPAAERMRKAGFFRKEEDLAAKESFIRNYVDQHYEERIRAAYDTSS